MQDTCQIGPFYSRCKMPAVEVCQYCGRSFCRDHTLQIAGYEAVCTGSRCRKKHNDLAEHADYRREVERRNLQEHCGEPGCRAESPFQCSLCKGLFCGEHVKVRSMGFRDQHSSYQRTVSACAHCWGRRKIW